MTRDIFVTSDTHLGHANFLKFVGDNGLRIRPEFDNVKQMNEFILESWNSVVKPGDIIYHCGDVMFGSKEEFELIWPKFHGRKRLLLGNHDDGKYLASGDFFQKVGIWRMFSEFGILLTHIPVHESTLRRENGQTLLNVIGHIHSNDPPPGPYFNVCVERTNYTPVHIDTLAAYRRDKIAEDES